MNDHHQLNMNKYQRTAPPPSPLPPAPVGTYRIIERCKKTPLSCFFQKHSFEDTQCQNSSQYVSSSQDQHRLLWTFIISNKRHKPTSTSSVFVSVVIRTGQTKTETREGKSQTTPAWTPTQLNLVSRLNRFFVWDPEDAPEHKVS